MKKLVLILLLIILSVYTHAQSLYDDRDETIYVKGNSTIYMGETPAYSYSIKRTYALNGLVSSRITIDTVNNDTLIKEYYTYSINKIKTYERWAKHSGFTGLAKLYSYVVSYDTNNYRTAFQTSEFKDTLHIPGGLDYKYNYWVHVVDIYGLNNGRISSVVLYTTDSENLLSIYGVSKTKIKWSDYYGERMSQYDIVRNDSMYPNTVFYSYKDQYGSYDKTEYKNMGYSNKLRAYKYIALHRETRNFDANGLNSITISDSLPQGWKPSSKVSYTYSNNSIATITTVLTDTNGNVNSVKREVFNNSRPSNLRRDDTIAMLVLDERDQQVLAVDLADKTSFSIYPNPSVGAINIVGLSDNLKTINFISSQGYVAHTITTDKSTINVDHVFTPGLYIVQVFESNNITRVSNLVVQ